MTIERVADLEVGAHYRLRNTGLVLVAVGEANAKASHSGVEEPLWLFAAADGSRMYSIPPVITRGDQHAYNRRAELVLTWTATGEPLPEDG